MILNQLSARWGVKQDRLAVIDSKIRTIYGR